MEIGTSVGAYQIVAKLGEGGMGAVYRARDTKLGRDVALKLLPAEFIGDRDRVARFQREAQLLAAINHPHIAAIYGLEEVGATQVLVLELVEGGTLGDRIRSGALPLDEAVAVARQIVDALEAAHEKGIVHRDLKPANIAFTADGRVKVLDFGLAKAIDPAASANASMSPTISVAATQAGVILGTAAYMSPEQAKGRATDKRTDVWAFGCVFYEMLTGRRAFEGEDVTDIIGAVVRLEPDWSALPTDVPPAIRTLIKRCLDKDRRTRIGDVAVARYLLTESPGLLASNQTQESSAATQTTSQSRGRGVTLGLGGLAAGVLLTALAAWALRAAPAPAPQPVRFTVETAGELRFAQSPNERRLAVSPDGSRIAYQAGPPAQGGMLALRPLNDINPKSMGAQTESARSPFYSPDGQWVAYWVLNETGLGLGLVKAAIAGGSRIAICDSPGSTRGGTWLPDGTIVFATTTPDGLFSVQASGGKPVAITTVNTANGEADHILPSSLPDVRAILFTIVGAKVGEASIAVLDLVTKETKVVLRGGSQAEYVDPGFLVYLSGTSLKAIRFDLDRRETAGDPIALVEDLADGPVTAAQFAVSPNGVLVYSTGSPSASAPRSLVWVARDGREEAIDAPPRAYNVSRISPDGGRVAVEIRDRNNDIWVWDLTRRTLAAISFEARGDYAPVWMPDGRRLLWASVLAANTVNIVGRNADGSGTVERYTEDPVTHFPTGLSPDGSRLVVMHAGQGMFDLKTVDVTAPPVPGQKKPPLLPLITSDAADWNGEVSPDGRWLVFQSRRSGQDEIYVTPYPKTGDGLWLVSSAGGSRPAWSRDGRELFYLDLENRLTVVSVQTSGQAFVAGTPKRLLDTAYYPGFTPAGVPLRGYDVSPDGKRFLMIKEASGESGAPPPKITVVVNLQEELKRLLPER